MTDLKLGGDVFTLQLIEVIRPRNITYTQLESHDLDVR